MSDLISRQQAIDVIDKEQKKIDVSDVSAMYAYSKCKAIIKQLPSAQPEQRTGKWIEYEQKFMTDRPFETIKKHVRECSLCRTKIAGFVGTMRYCPNCGAKMEVTT